MNYNEIFLTDREFSSLKLFKKIPSIKLSELPHGSTHLLDLGMIARLRDNNSLFAITQTGLDYIKFKNKKTFIEFYPHILSTISLLVAIGALIVAIIAL